MTKARTTLDKINPIIKKKINSMVNGSVDLCNLELSVDDLEYLCKALGKNTDVNTLILTNCQLDDTKANILLSLINENNHIIAINLSNNNSVSFVKLLEIDESLTLNKQRLEANIELEPDSHYLSSSPPAPRKKNSLKKLVDFFFKTNEADSKPSIIRVDDIDDVDAFYAEGKGPIKRINM